MAHTAAYVEAWGSWNGDQNILVFSHGEKGRGWENQRTLLLNAWWKLFSAELAFQVNSSQPSHEPLESGRERTCWVGDGCGTTSRSSGSWRQPPHQAAYGGMWRGHGGSSVPSGATQPRKSNQRPAEAAPFHRVQADMVAPGSPSKKRGSTRLGLIHPP